MSLAQFDKVPDSWDIFVTFLQQPDTGASPSWVAKWERGFSSLATDLESGKIHDAVKQHTVVRFSQSGRILYTKVIALGQVSVYVFVHHNLGQDLTHWRDEMQSLETRLEATPAVLEKSRTKQSIQLALRDLITMKMDGSQIRDSVELRVDVGYTGLNHVCGWWISFI